MQSDDVVRMIDAKINDRILDIKIGKLPLFNPFGYNDKDVPLVHFNNLDEYDDFSVFIENIEYTYKDYLVIQTYHPFALYHDKEPNVDNFVIIKYVENDKLIFGMVRLDHWYANIVKNLVDLHKMGFDFSHLIVDWNISIKRNY